LIYYLGDSFFLKSNQFAAYKIFSNEVNCKMEKVSMAWYKSKIGMIKITGNEKGILSVDFSNAKSNPTSKKKQKHLYHHINECLHQLDEYFSGKRKKFNLKLQFSGTEFQKKVWKALIKISYGEVVSYKYIARMVGNENASRAVGNANNKNRIAIIIPCHRVIAADGSLAGYGGGVSRKQWLLKHEKKHV
jgi:methylated-DNA-[protein]-cysteine S-methyltransferase